MRPTYVLAISLAALLSKCNLASKNTTFAASRTTNNLQASSVNYVTTKIKNNTVLFMPPQDVNRLTDKSLFEISGLVPSLGNSGCLWAEEDSGNPNQIQLINQDGSVLARFTLDGLDNHDWEDIAIGPGPVEGETYIYLADIGDNMSIHSEKTVYRFPEPVINNHQFPFEGHISAVDAIRLHLPDGPQNAEAILIDPTTKDLFILTKDDQSAVYRAAFPQSTVLPTLMTRLLTLPFKNVTSAAVSAKGNEILVLTYEQLFHYQRRQGETIIEAFNRTPQQLPLAIEPQGEAVGWEPDGSGYYTTSEKTAATEQVIHFYRRRTPGHDK